MTASTLDRNSLPQMMDPPIIGAFQHVNNTNFPPLLSAASPSHPQINVLPYVPKGRIPVLFGLVAPSSQYSYYFLAMLAT